MVVRTQKKMRKARGYNRRRGNGKRCRGAGNRGGRGRAGLGKRAAHNRFKIIKEEGHSNYLGKNGFTSVKQVKKFHPTAINVDQVEKLAAKLGKTELNLAKLGFEKLLGNGKITTKLIINVPNFTESAKQKIEAAGGKINSEEQ